MPTAMLCVLVVLAAVVLARLLTTGDAEAGTGVVDGTTPAVAGARVESGQLMRSALAAATEQGGGADARVVDAGVISVTSTDASVLLFTDVTGADGETSLKRIVMTLHREDGRWRLTGERPV